MILQFFVELINRTVTYYDGAPAVNPHLHRDA